jgi:hypothetical protein
MLVFIRVAERMNAHLHVQALRLEALIKATGREVAQVSKKYVWTSFLLPVGL